MRQDIRRRSLGVPGCPPCARLAGKRQFDVIIVAGALVVLSPLLAFCALAVRLSSRGPILYRGQRVGQGGGDFEILKFRTMRVDHSERDQLTTARNDRRVTRVGSFLRRYKLDELPQLVNVLRGDMSIVGPRPEFRAWVDYYTDEEMAIFSVRPGLTDYSSIALVRLGDMVDAERADAQYLELILPRKNELRLKYISNLSWHTDLVLIAATVRAIGRRR